MVTFAALVTLTDDTWLFRREIRVWLLLPLDVCIGILAIGTPNAVIRWYGSGAGG
jgi:hypothetical protein